MHCAWHSAFSPIVQFTVPCHRVPSVYTLRCQQWLFALRRAFSPFVFGPIRADTGALWFHNDRPVLQCLQQKSLTKSNTKYALSGSYNGFLEDSYKVLHTVYREHLMCLNRPRHRCYLGLKMTVCLTRTSDLTVQVFGNTFFNM